MLERYDPFGRPMSLRQLMDRLIEDAFIVPGEGRLTGAGDAAMDVYEEGDDLVVEAQLPGVKPEDVDVSVERGLLTIRAESKAETERKDRNYFVRERRSGSIRRTLRLPETADADACQATFEHGVLRLRFPKTEAAKPRRIQVGSGSQRAMPGAGGSSGSEGTSGTGQTGGGART